MNVSQEVINVFDESLRLHIQSVQNAGRILGVPEEQLLRHDLSKWSNEEFHAYAQHFHGGGCPNEFAIAWLHHIHYNEHHWQHWIFPDGYSPKDSNVENGVIEMPEHFALEMIADWMGASYAYTQSWDMTDWLVKNIPRIRLHSKTQEYVYHILGGQGYFNMGRFLS